MMDFSWMIFPSRSKAITAPLVSLSVPNTMLLEGSWGWIQIAGSSVSLTVFSVMISGAMAGNLLPWSQEAKRTLRHTKMDVFFIVVLVFWAGRTLIVRLPVLVTIDLVFE